MFRTIWNACFALRDVRNERSRPRRRLTLEPLENRLPTAADLFAALVATPASDWAAAGQALAVSAQVQNIGDASAGSYQVEYRLSTDNVITTADTLLGTSSQVGLDAGATANLSQSVTVPAATAKGVYYVGVRIVFSDADAANNTAAEATTTAVYLTSITGTVNYGRSTKSVAIRPYQGGGTPIFDDRPTWVVIHGRNSSPSVSYLVGLSAAIDGYSASDQVLVLDWSAAAASGLIGGSGENYIIPVGTWMADKLSTYGLTPDELHLVGHSWVRMSPPKRPSAFRPQVVYPRSIRSWLSILPSTIPAVVTTRRPPARSISPATHKSPGPSTPTAVRGARPPSPRPLTSRSS